MPVPAPSTTQYEDEVIAEPTPTAVSASSTSISTSNHLIYDLSPNTTLTPSQFSDFSPEEYDKDEDSSNTIDASTSGLKRIEKGRKKSAVSKSVVTSRAQFGLVVAGVVFVYLL